MSSIRENSSSADQVYLRPDVKLEPLVCGWYAWSHLIAPAQLALHVTYRILPLMQSFVTNPAVHIAASSDPKMYGGPFMSLGEQDIAQVKALIERTRLDCAALIQFAQDLKALDAMLQDKATGYSLNEYYASLPPSLQGLVELLYDINHKPNIRVFEALMYADRLTDAVQEIRISLERDADRQFFMSTPRLARKGTLIRKMRFDDARLDRLAAMRVQAAPFEDIAAAFEIAAADLPDFREFFTSAAPVRNGEAGYGGDDVRMRYFGHACVLFQTRETAVLFDPFVSTENGPDQRYTIADLPDFIDYVVLTHSHQDHFNAEMLIQLRSRIGRIVVPTSNSGNIADPAIKLTLQALGFERIDVLDAFDEVALPGGKIVSLPFTGEHADLSIYSKQAIALTIGGNKFMFLIDSDGRDAMLYRRLMRRIGPVDALFIGMECHGAPLTWLYEPLLGKPVNRRNNESRRLSGADCARAEHILAEVAAPRVFVYAMGQEPWMKFIMGLEYEPDSIQLVESTRFVEQCNSRGIAAERLYGSKEVIFPHKAAGAHDC
jgi:L-ascorbate metabolism protein UlaG (beta-lactamase superfamily)